MALGAEHRNWRSDVLALVEYIESWANTSANSYFNHPSNWPDLSPWPLDYVAVDFWGPGGRGDPIDYNEGNRIISYIWNDPNPPMVRYYIWQREMYGVLLEWIGTGQYWYEPYGVLDDTDDFHDIHVHVTFWDQGGW